MYPESQEWSEPAVATSSRTAGPRGTQGRFAATSYSPEKGIACLFITPGNGACGKKSAVQNRDQTPGPTSRFSV